MQLAYILQSSCKGLKFAQLCHLSLICLIFPDCAICCPLSHTRDQIHLTV